MAAPNQGIINNTMPAEYGAAVTKSDSTVLAPTRGLYIGVGGDLTVTMAGDAADVVFKNALAGSVIPIRVTKVKAATTATDIVALY